MRRLLALVSAIVLVDTVFYSAITPLLPSYVDDLGLTKTEAGILSGAYAGGTLAASLPAGYAASRFGVRPILLTTLALMSVACVAFGFGDTFGILVAARVVQGVAGAGSWAAGLAWLTAATPREKRGAYIGIAIGTAIAGQIGGPVIGAAAHVSSTELVFSAVAVFAAALAIGVVVQPRPPVTPPATGLRGALREPRVIAGAWLMTLAALFYGTFAVLVPLRLDDLGLTAAAIGAVFLGAAISEALASPFVGRLSDSAGRLVPVRLGLAGVVVSCVLLPLPDVGWLLAVIALLGAGLVGILWTPATALMSDGAEIAGLPQAMAFGVINLAWAGGIVAGSGGGSALADATSDAVPYVLFGVVALVTLAAVVVRGRRLQASMPRASRAADSAASS